MIRAPKQLSFRVQFKNQSAFLVCLEIDGYFSPWVDRRALRRHSVISRAVALGI